MEWHGRYNDDVSYPEYGRDYQAPSQNIQYTYDPHGILSQENLFHNNYYKPEVIGAAAYPQNHQPTSLQYGPYEDMAAYHSSTPVPSRVHINPNFKPKFTTNPEDRVHINPYFKPKVAVNLELNAKRNQSNRVHINPHWRGPAEATSAVPQVSSSVGDSSKRKTIFVNPRVLPHLKKESSSCPDQLDIREVRTVPIKTCNPAGVLSLNANTAMQQNNDVGTESRFLALGSTKLIYQSNQELPESCASPRNDSHASSFVQLGAGEDLRKNSGLNTNKIAKQISSKYRLVRTLSCTANPVKMTKWSSISSVKRNRKKSVGRQTQPSKSVYKFIRRSDVEEPVTKSLNSYPAKETLKKIPSAFGGNKERSIEISNGKGCVKKNVCSRFKLIKVQQPHQEHQQASLSSMKKPNTVKTRYKLVRRSTTDTKYTSKTASSKKPCSSAPTFQSQVSTMKTRFKLARNLTADSITSGRNISRFAIYSLPPYKQGRKAVLLRNFRALNYMKSRNIFFRNISWQKDKFLPSIYTPNISQTSLTQSNVSKKLKNNTSLKSSNKRLLNIGGVLYRSTRTSLTRTHPTKSKQRVLFIRGKKFVMDDEGMTLRPASNTKDSLPKVQDCRKEPSISRVDIGGVTFTRRGGNTLVRTNTHYARNVLSIAKSRSIALLRGKLHKNNQPCLIYHRFGKCRAHEKNKCWRLHDPKNIAICRKFLQGLCESESCLLSHDVGPEKMPTCRYFLEGCCVRDNCPYLHVKLNAHAAICRQFLNGYCEAGDMCNKRHVNICPDFEQHGKCNKGKYCPYPHKMKSKTVVKDGSRGRNEEIHTTKVEVMNRVGGTLKKTTLGEAEKRKRYYNDGMALESQGREELEASSTLDSTNQDSSHSDNDESLTETHCDGMVGNRELRRAAIGILPAYIPLE